MTIRGTQDAAVSHLLNVIDGGREKRQSEDAAVRNLLAADPKNPREQRDDYDDPLVREMRKQLQQ